MARRVLNRRELRDAAESAEEAGKTAKTTKKKKKAAKKKSRSTTSRSRSKKKAKEAPIGGLKLVWGVFDNTNEQVETFEYRDRKKADKLASDLTKKHGATHFVKPIKEPMG